MIGAGVFAVFAPAAAAAGSWLLAALGLAAVVAYCNATSSARLAARHPESGGTYVYGRRRLGPFWGYLAGWGFTVGKTASCAAMALTFGAYAAPGLARPPAVAAVVVLTVLNLSGVRRSARAARLMVGFVLLVLAAVVAAAFLPDTGVMTGVPGGDHAPNAKVVDKEQVIEVGSLDDLPPGLHLILDPEVTGWGVLQAAGLLFFAFAGYARVATLGEEVRDPGRTIPRAIGIALGLTLVVYTLVAAAALHTLGPGLLAASPEPLVEVVKVGGERWLEPVVRAGAAMASLGALLALMMGVSRTVLAMARERDLPGALAAVAPRPPAPPPAARGGGGAGGVAGEEVDLPRRGAHRHRLAVDRVVAGARHGLGGQVEPELHVVDVQGGVRRGAADQPVAVGVVDERGGSARLGDRFEVALRVPGQLLLGAAGPAHDGVAGGVVLVGGGLLGGRPGGRDRGERVRPGLPGGGVGVVADDLLPAAERVVGLLGPVAGGVVGVAGGVRGDAADQRGARLAGGAGVGGRPRGGEPAQVVVGEALGVGGRPVGDPGDVAAGVVGVVQVQVGGGAGVPVELGPDEPAGALLVGVGQPGLARARAELVLERLAELAVAGVGDVRGQALDLRGLAQRVVPVGDGLGGQPAGVRERDGLHLVVGGVAGVEDVRAGELSFPGRDGHALAERAVLPVDGLDLGGVGLLPRPPDGLGQVALGQRVVAPLGQQRPGGRTLPGRGPAAERVIGVHEGASAGVGAGDLLVQVVEHPGGDALVRVLGLDLAVTQVVVVPPDVARRVGHGGEPARPVVGVLGGLVVAGRGRALVLAQLHAPALGVGDEGGGALAGRRGHMRPVGEAPDGGLPLLLALDAEALRGQFAGPVEGGDDLAGDVVVRHLEHVRLRVAGGVVAVVGLGHLADRVVEDVGDDPAAAGRGLLGLARAQQPVVELVAGDVGAVGGERPGGDDVRAVGADQVGVLGVGRLARRLVPVVLPHLDQATERVVLQVGAAAVLVHLRDRLAPRGLDIGDVGVAERVDGAHLGRRPAGRRHVRGRRGAAGGVGLRRHAAVGVVRAGHVQHVPGRAPVVGGQLLLPGHVAAQRGLPERPAVEVEPFVRQHVGGPLRLDRARLADGLDPAGEVEHPGGGVAGVGVAGADVVSRVGDVAEVGHLGDEAVLVVRALLGGAQPGAVLLEVAGGHLRGLHDVRGLGHALERELGGPAPPGLLGGGGQDFPAVAVVHDRLQVRPGELVVVLARLPLAVGDLDVLAAAVGQPVAVHAAVVAVLGHRARPVLAVALPDPYAGEAAPVRPGPLLGLDQDVLGVAPGRPVEILVVGDQPRGARGAVDLHGLRDHVLVEPVQHLRLVLRRPPLREAALGVAVGRGQVRRRALLGRVGHPGLRAGLAVDRLDAPPVQRGAALVGVHPVLQLHPGEGHLGQRDGAADVAGVPDRGQPERRAQPVAGGGEGVGERPGVHVPVLGAGADLRRHLRQPLAGPERRRQPVLARLARLAVAVERHVRPVAGGVLGELGRLAGDRAARHAPLGHGEHRPRRRRDGEQLGRTVAVVDAGQVAAAHVRGAQVGLLVAAVVVALRLVPVRERVAVPVDRVVQVPPPGLLAPGVGGGGVVARLAGLVAEHRHRPGRLRLGLARGPAGQPVQAEVVLGAVGGGEPPVLAVVVAVGGAGEQLDPGAVVALGTPLLGGGVLDQLHGGAVEHQRGVVVVPAQVAGLAPVGHAGLVAALDVAAGGQVEALARPGHLVVGGGGVPVHALRGVREVDHGLVTADGRRHPHRVAPGEVARLGADAPLRRRRQRRGGVVAGGAGGGGGERVQLGAGGGDVHLGPDHAGLDVVLGGHRLRRGAAGRRVRQCAILELDQPQPVGVVAAEGVPEAGVVQLDAGRAAPGRALPTGQAQRHAGDAGGLGPVEHLDLDPFRRRLGPPHRLLGGGDLHRQRAGDRPGLVTRRRLGCAGLRPGRVRRLVDRPLGCGVAGLGEHGDRTSRHRLLLLHLRPLPALGLGRHGVHQRDDHDDRHGGAGPDEPAELAREPVEDQKGRTLVLGDLLEVVHPHRPELRQGVRRRGVIRRRAGRCPCRPVRPGRSGRRRRSRASAR
ncbi:amino acid permease [Nonomuraea corallina]|uniref:amino acid permease n=1 Tax=Nonomuraea corallina TaxID=2989783 RepID=UPI0038CD7052